MLKDKNCQDFLQKIGGEIDELIAIKIPEESRSREADEIKKIAENLGIKSQTAKNFDDAFGKIKTDEKALTMVCGSLYLAGKFLEENRTKGRICDSF